MKSRDEVVAQMALIAGLLAVGIMFASDYLKYNTISLLAMLSGFIAIGVYGWYFLKIAKTKLKSGDGE